MKKLTILLSIMMIAISCTPKISPLAVFDVYQDEPMAVTFFNRSVYADTYLWNFGDGCTSTEESPKHRYISKGVYAISLTVTNAYGADTYVEVVTIEEPTKCYLSGVTFTNIHSKYYNEYIAFGLFESNEWISITNWVLLSSANIPFDYMYASPRLLDISNLGYYDVCLYWSDTPSSSIAYLSPFFKKNLWKYQISNRFPTEITMQDEIGNSLLLHFTWE